MYFVNINFPIDLNKNWIEIVHLDNSLQLFSVITYEKESIHLT